MTNKGAPMRANHANPAKRSLGATRHAMTSKTSPRPLPNQKPRCMVVEKLVFVQVSSSITRKKPAIENDRR